MKEGIRRPPRPDPLEYVRRTYHVEAYVGKRIKWHGKTGTITGGDSHIHVLFDGAKAWVPVHPTDDVEYLPA